VYDSKHLGTMQCVVVRIACVPTLDPAKLCVKIFLDPYNTLNSTKTYSTCHKVLWY